MNRLRGYARQRGLAALLATLGAALLLGASSSASPDVLTAQADTAADCNGNGVTDLQEPAAANRDDDGDGLCNGVDPCPAEASATNDGAGCRMQAITVPWVPANPSIPHPTYSGRVTTLKAIARYGGNQYMWDFGDGSPATAWTAISNPYDLGIAHAYAGAVGRLFAATVSVRHSSNPASVASATYRLRIEQASAALPATEDRPQTDVRTRIAIDDALWFLHRSLTRSTFADGAPGYAQPYGLWTDPATTCAAVEAFEQHGSLPGRARSTDPYAENVERGLAYVLSGSRAVPITNQLRGNPDVNGNGLGFLASSSVHERATYDHAACTVALANSGAPARTAKTGPANVYGRSYSALAQDAVDWFAFAQAEGTSLGGGYARGGWGYTPNGDANGEISRWPIIAMDAAERRLGATVPAFVRQEIPYYLNFSHNTSQTNDNGAWGWQAATTSPAAGFTAAGIFATTFLGQPATHPDIQAALGWLYRNWTTPSGHPNIFGNLGDSDAMYTGMRAFEGASDPITQITNYDYVAATPLIAGFDWYYSVAPKEGYARYLVRTQRADGSWVDLTSLSGTHLSNTNAWTARDAQILGRGDGQQAIADVGGPYITERNTPTTLDASASSGDTLAYAWDLDDDGAFDDALGASTTFTPVAYALYPVCVRVTDSAGRRNTACTTVTVKPPPHPPVARISGATGTVDQPVVLSAAGSTDVDGDPLSFQWDLDNDGDFDDGTGLTVAPTFTVPRTYVACVRATDDPSSNPVPYAAAATSDFACLFLVIAPTPPNRAPVAAIATPSVQITGLVPRAVTLTSTSTDPDGDPLTYTWTFDGPGTTTGADSASATHTFTSYGTFGARLTVSDGSLSATADATVTIVDGSPQTPAGLVALAAPGSIALSWDAGANATGYVVSRSSDGVGYSQLATAAGTTYTDSATTPGATYWYTVASTNNFGTSAASAAASATVPPAVPAGVTAQSSGAAVSVRWLSAQGATAYVVVRAADGGSATPVASVTTEAYLDTDVLTGHTYGYSVIATSGAASSAPSAMVSVTVLGTPPTLTYAGNEGFYTVDQTVSIRCVTTPGTAPIATSTCVDVTGPAYTFGLGEHSYEATVTDTAGLSDTATTSFRVGVTTTGLCSLTVRFVEGSAKYRALPPAARANGTRVATGVCQMLTLIDARLAPARKVPLVGAYRRGVTALASAGWLTPAQARMLAALAGSI